MPDLGVLTRGALGSRGASNWFVLRWLRKSVSCSKSSLEFEQVEERREGGEWVFQKVAGLK